MAFAASGLTRLAGASGVSLWHYTTTDTIATVNTAGYFNDASAMMNVNDVIIAVTSTGTTPVVSHTYVNANSSGTVDVVDGVAITNTDSD
jgi:N-acetylmuramic acid 6-phosphate (MurNAc-6-P) etherase